ncbi:Type III-A CRISPR-associated RAMP protein Csm3 [Hyella patelloides LEGE 07179]|uniref:CRISPR system Cms endoribonuclease Csm3 n=1 Tax=Hyella patelloides LEGE 07179 TaxID=945734 RepID=A0A563W394_9CYAN|nr:type III-A CRISPR-associated RAMP protein Csm3 [Hyella patelloides]VEP18161.1 Type III-A CRISPR-associated RAMP protein Csm3 [Hyella patelloides LEGE 07179]
MPRLIKPKKLFGKFFITVDIVIETGLHIGGGGETLDIGGLDHSVIRDPISRHPYIPGSSLKGKLRSILERLENKPVNRPGGSGTYRYESDDLEEGYSEIGEQSNKQTIKFKGAKNCPVSRIFGSTGVSCWVKKSICEEQDLELVKSEERNDLGNNEKYVFVKGRSSTARLIVRDAYLTDNSAKLLEKIDTGLYMTEWKFENGIDRITAAANPRQVERVPKDSEFEVELVYTVEDFTDEEQNSGQLINRAEIFTEAHRDIKNILRAMMVLEDDGLGGNISRGYGKISFKNWKFQYKNYQDFNNDPLQPLSSKELSASIEAKVTNQLPAKFPEIQALLPTIEQSKLDSEENEDSV